MGALHRAVDRVDKFANVVLESRLNKTFRLSHVDVFFGEAIEVCANEVDSP